MLFMFLNVNRHEVVAAIRWQKPDELREKNKGITLGRYALFDC